MYSGPGNEKAKDRKNIYEKGKPIWLNCISLVPSLPSWAMKFLGNEGERNGRISDTQIICEFWKIPQDHELGYRREKTVWIPNYS